MRFQVKEPKIIFDERTFSLINVETGEVIEEKLAFESFYPLPDPNEPN